MNQDQGNPLLDDFMSNSGRCIHKWVDYFDVYHRAFQKYRGKPITFLEIGVQNGGSTKMWSRYFGPSAKIIGVDIDPNCRSLESEGYEIWIGDQADPEFWREFKAKHAEIDIVLDDGGHTMQQQINTFEALFPILKNNGTYLCEDTHTSYFQTHGGGHKKPGTFHEYVKNLVDEMHAWYFAPSDKLADAYIARNLYAISVFDSIVVLEKRLKNEPLALVRGYDGHSTPPRIMGLRDIRRFGGVSD